MRLCFVFACRVAEVLILRSWCVIFCLNVLFDVSLFRFAVLRTAARRFLFCGLGVLFFCLNVLFDVSLFRFAV